MGIKITELTEITSPASDDVLPVVQTSSGNTRKITVANLAAQGPAGADGNTWLSGSGAPSDANGADGDFYMDTSANTYYGPKAGGTWTGTGPTSLVGPAGADGADGIDGTNGTDGADGADGSTWISGSGTPSDGIGVDGDFYLDTTISSYYGPKAGGTWTGTGPTSLVGPAGPAGADGTGSGLAGLFKQSKLESDIDNEYVVLTNDDPTDNGDYILMSGNIAANGTDGAHLYQYEISSVVKNNHLYHVAPYSSDNTATNKSSYSGVQVIDVNLKTKGVVTQRIDTAFTIGELHQVPSLVVLDDGTIVIAFDKLTSTGHNGGVDIYTTSTPYDITTLTYRTEIGGGSWANSYPALFALKSGRIICDMRNSTSSDVQHRSISYSDDKGVSWSTPYILIDTGNANIWAYAANNAAYLNRDAYYCFLNPIDKTGGSDRYKKAYALKTEDGLTWTNFDGSFSKTFAAGETTTYVTPSELDANFMYYSSTIPADLSMIGCYPVVKSNGDIFVAAREYNYDTATSYAFTLDITNPSGTTIVTRTNHTLTTLSGYSTPYIFASSALPNDVLIIGIKHNHSSDKTLHKEELWVSTDDGATWEVYWPEVGVLGFTSSQGFSQSTFAFNHNKDDNRVVSLLEGRGGTSTYGPARLFIQAFSY